MKLSKFAHGDKMTTSNSHPAAKQWPLLRKISIISLVAVIVTAFALMFLYKQDQLAEHGELFAHEGDTTVFSLMSALNDQVYALIDKSDGLDSLTIKTNLGFEPFINAQEIFRRYGILKLKFYNRSGVTIYSSSKAEIGEANSHSDMLAKALSGETTHKLEFRNTFSSSIGEKHGVYVALTFMPLSKIGKHIGAIEIYVDATQTVSRMQDKAIQLGMVILLAFAIQYVVLFFVVRKAFR